MTPQTCHGVKRLVGSRGRAERDSGRVRGGIWASVAPIDWHGVSSVRLFILRRGAPNHPHPDPLPSRGRRVTKLRLGRPSPPSPELCRRGGGGRGGGMTEPAQPATVLMRAIISSTALSTGIFSLTTRFIALAQTFSLLRTVNFQFLVDSNVTVPLAYWSCIALRWRSSVQNRRSCAAFVTR